VAICFHECFLGHVLGKPAITRHGISSGVGHALKAFNDRAESFQVAALRSQY